MPTSQVRGLRLCSRAAGTRTEDGNWEVFRFSSESLSLGSEEGSRASQWLPWPRGFPEAG